MNKPNKSHIRDIGKDVVYDSQSVQRLINMFTKDGQKQKAEKIIYGAIEKLMTSEHVGNMTGAEIIDSIVAKVSPTVEAVSKRIKGATLPIPTEVSKRRGQMLAFRWIRTGAIAKRGKESSTLKDALYSELLDALQDRGFAIKRRDETHATARANRAFAHFSR